MAPAGSEFYFALRRCLEFVTVWLNVLAVRFSAGSFSSFFYTLSTFLSRFYLTTFLFLNFNGKGLKLFLTIGAS